MTEKLTDEDLLAFPCEFPIKVMGETSDDFAATMVEVIRAIDASFDASKVEMRASTGGRFISLTCTVQATSRAHLDDIYRALTSHPLSKYVL
jgi:uncharacterized protein